MYSETVQEIWKMLIGDNVLRGRYGLTCRQHDSIEDELIIECAEGRKKECLLQSLKIHNR